ncbi:MAG: L,D-transpeptidase [Pseudomonadota bacterium]
MATAVHISIPAQRLTLTRGDGTAQRFAVSTARNGPGQQRGSECTPLGHHVIRARIGAGLDPRAVLCARRPTGEIYSPALAAREPDRDWVLGRILWLSGVERGFNRLGDVDTMQRYIYIHGTPDTEPLGVAASHGCIRMRPEDVVALFDAVTVGTPVHIDAERERP